MVNETPNPAADSTPADSANTGSEASEQTAAENATAENATAENASADGLTATFVPSADQLRAEAVLSAAEATAAEQTIRGVANVIERVIVGKRRVVELVVSALIADGHVLLEDVPGTGKTQLARALAKAFAGENSRVQFTPDLLPGDITGINVYNQGNQSFEFHAGPIFANIVLADEINRASPKTQSALLEVMAERQVTVDGETYPVEQPFLVIATQNPVEQAGTYKLPEAQLDRFMLKTSLGYPDSAATREILTGLAQPADLTAVLSAEQVLALRAEAARVYVAPAIVAYVTELLEATRRLEQVRLGASIRGGLSLIALARAWALVQGRHYVTPDDIRDLAVTVLAHRLVLKPEAEFDGVLPETLIDNVLLSTRAPQENAS